MSLFENGNPFSEQFLRWKLWARWADYVGPTVAEATEPVSLRRGILYLWVPNSSWIHHLSFMKEQIRDSLNKKLSQPVIREVRLTLDRKAVPRDDEGKGTLKAWINKIAPQDKDLE
ncbi:MAG: DUF721 domain-containing protein [Bdellovibrionaceae bacterium]|nr:DUF721 domain-containing protein [Pseudobdellovibrionaceae bacterium]